MASSLFHWNRQTGRHKQTGQWANSQSLRERERDSDMEHDPVWHNTCTRAVPTSTDDIIWPLILVIQIVWAKLSTGQDSGGQWCHAIVGTLHCLALDITVHDLGGIETFLVATILALTCHQGGTSKKKYSKHVTPFCLVAPQHWSWLNQGTPCCYTTGLDLPSRRHQ